MHINLNRESTWPCHRAPLVDMVRGPQTFITPHSYQNPRPQRQSLRAFGSGIPVVLSSTPGSIPAVSECVRFAIDVVGDLVTGLASGTNGIGSFHLVAWEVGLQ